MIAIDTNLLVYSHRRDAPMHAEALRCVRGLAEGGRAWAIPWHCVYEFLAITTHRGIYRPASTRAQAIAQVDAWRAAPHLSVLGETDGYWESFRDVLALSKVTGGGVYDARIAAICVAHGVDELWSADRDFSRFPGLRVRNPLIEV